MAISKKIFIAGALIIGLQPIAYGYNAAVLNNQITTIEMAKNTLKQYDSPPAVEATRYLKNVIRNPYSMSDETVIKLATLLNVKTYSYETVDTFANSILIIKAQEETQALKAEEQEKAQAFKAEEQRNIESNECNYRYNKFQIREAVKTTAIATTAAIILAYKIHNDISQIITYKKNDFMNQIAQRINNNNNNNNDNNNSLPIANKESHWLNYAV